MYSKYAKLRDDRNLTDYEVSRQTGIATSTLTDWKMERYTPKVDKIQRIASFFGVPLEYFLDGKEE